LTKVGGFKIGVCWMMTDPDAKGDGGKRSYLGQPGQWRSFDTELFDLLEKAKLKPEPEMRDLLQIENVGLIPNALFYNATTPDKLALRLDFHRDCLSAFATCDLAFFDPDNGLNVQSCPKGRKNSSKYVYTLISRGAENPW
jgi:hypothetical protein